MWATYTGIGHISLPIKKGEGGLEDGFEDGFEDGGGWGAFSLFIAAYTNMDTIPLAYRKSHRSFHMPHHLLYQANAPLDLQSSFLSGVNVCAS